MLRLLRRLPWSSCLVLAWMLVGGCAWLSSYEKPAFNQGAGANGAATLVVPFREPERNRWYGESSNGTLVAEVLKEWARREADPVYVEGEDVEQVMEAVREWRKERISAEDWRSLVAGLGVEYVVAGKLEEIRLREENVVGLYDASAAAEYRVIHAPTGRVAHEGRAVGRYGHGRDMVLTDTPSYENDEKVSRRVLHRLAEEIGKDLYGYYPE